MLVFGPRRRRLEGLAASPTAKSPQQQRTVRRRLIAPVRGAGAGDRRAAPDRRRSTLSTTTSKGEVLPISEVIASSFINQLQKPCVTDDVLRRRRGEDAAPPPPPDNIPHQQVGSKQLSDCGYGPRPLRHRLCACALSPTQHSSPLDFGSVLSTGISTAALHGVSSPCEPPRGGAPSREDRRLTPIPLSENRTRCRRRRWPWRRSWARSSPGRGL